MSQGFLESSHNSRKVSGMKTSYGAVLPVLLSFLLLLQDARTLLAYNAGLVRPLQGNPRMSAAGAPGRDGAPKSTAEPMTTRLHALRRVAAVSLFPATVSGALVAFPGDARAEKGAAAEAQGAKQWISGKGAQPKGSEDKTGTRKEAKYLRCLSNCLAECQKPTYGPERDREECLQVCQDECCTSYEQCTYTVTQNK